MSWVDGMPLRGSEVRFWEQCYLVALESGSAFPCYAADQAVRNRRLRLDDAPEALPGGPYR